jgi:hypothetical protein
MIKGVEGVETNENSRFIDHSQATPWETFVSEIHEFVKSYSFAVPETHNKYICYKDIFFYICSLHSNLNVLMSLHSLYDVTDGFLIQVDASQLNPSIKEIVISAIMTASSYEANLLFF